MYSLIFLNKLGQQIRYYRSQQHISRADLSEKLGMHKTYVGSIERGERNVSIMTVISIAKGLNISVFELLSFMEEENLKIS